MANTMRVWLEYADTDQTYMYEFNDVPDEALIEANVQAAVQACNARIREPQGSVTFGHLFKIGGAYNQAIGVAKVSAISSHEVSILNAGGN